VSIPEPPETLKALFDEAEERFAKADAAAGAAGLMMDEINAAMEDSLRRERRREMAIDRILAAEDARSAITDSLDDGAAERLVPSKRKRAKKQRAERVSPVTDGILREVPLCGADWSMGNKAILKMLLKYRNISPKQVSEQQEATLIQQIKRAKNAFRERGSSGT
jgi:hypothetical protein